MHKKLLLFGGTGFVGTSIARKALLRGYRVVVATRRGVPEATSPLETLAQRARVVGGPRAAHEATVEGPFAARAKPALVSSSADPCEGDGLVDAVNSVAAENALDFVAIDAASRSQVFHFMHDHPDATAVISCIGSLVRDYDEARELNADTNINIAAGVCHEKLLPNAKKMVYVSAEPYNTYTPIIGSKALLKGYFHGKAAAEQAVLQNLKERGVVLRPGFIYGTRYVPVSSAVNTAGSVLPLPLGWVGYPLDVVLRAVGGRKLFTPPVHVEVVAECAIRACEWAGLPEKEFSGVVDVYKMHEVHDQEDGTLPAARKHA